MWQLIACLFLCYICGNQGRVQIRFVFEYQKCGAFVLKITKGCIFVLLFGLYLKSICKYNQIHIQITILPTKGKALPDINCGQAAHKLWAGSTEKIGLQWSWSNISINEWMGSQWSLSIAIKAGIHRKGASKNPAVTCCVNILGQEKGTQVSSIAGEELPTSWYSSTNKVSLVYSTHCDTLEL